MPKLPRPEYPRPQFIRQDSWLNLNGQWDFSFADATFDQKITVPFAFQSPLSGIDVQDFHDVVWYRRRFDLPEAMAGKRIFLNFGAVDYMCQVWVNGQLATRHTGGHVGFQVEISSLVQGKDNELVIKVIDESLDLEMPRGKQYWLAKPAGLFTRYTRTTGIWQTVWLEAAADTHLKKVWLTPDLDNSAINISYEIDGDMSGKVLEAQISLAGLVLASYTLDDGASQGAFQGYIDKQALLRKGINPDIAWTPSRPTLFDIKFSIKKAGVVEDEVWSYFGMRKVSIAKGKFMLNNRPYYQRLVLDQGYWPDSLMTAPDDAAFRRDIELAKEMGFNGARKHQKIEDPRFLYWADKLGFLVWGEAANNFVFSRRGVQWLLDEWTAAVVRDYNHPSLVVWAPINESWGVENILHDKAQQSFSLALVNLTKALDQTRPVISNDGWEHTESDLLTIHDYGQSGEELQERYSDLTRLLDITVSGRCIYAQGYAYEGQPILLTELGGISLQTGYSEGRGYSMATSTEDFIKRYSEVVLAIRKSGLLQGFCYTQLTDIEQEINGLLTADRQPKVEPEIIRKINLGLVED